MDGLKDKDFRLGAWVVAPKLNGLSCNGKTVHLEPKVMQVLLCLAEAGDVVPKEKLMGTVWAGTFVTDDVLTRSISELRKVFEDDAKNPQYIQTIPKGGYRLLIRPEEMGSGNGAGPSAAEKAASSAGAPEREFGEGGVKGDSLNTADGPIVGRPRLWKLAAVAGVAVVAVLASIVVWRRISAAPSTPTNRALLAVLPFQNLNNDPAQDYFADGLTAEMISRFGRLPTDRLGVIAWASMMRYKGANKSEDEVGRELGANYILEGTVRREGEHVRITAELVKTGERSHIWTNSYDGDLRDVLALQSRVAQEIAGEIQARMNPERSVAADGIRRPTWPPGATENQGPVNAEGYDAYLRGKALTDGGQMMDVAAEHLKRAIALNPNYAPPYITLAMYYRMQASWEFAPSKSSYANAKAAVVKALELDPGSGAPHRELAWIEWRGDWNFAQADEEYQLAVKIDPGNASIHEGYSLYLKSMGRYEEALREIELCLQLSPMQAISHANAGTVLGLLHQYDAAMEEFSKAQRLDEKSEYVYRRMGAVQLWEGKNGEAIETFQKAVRSSNGRPEAIAWLGYAYAVSGKRADAQEVFEELLRNSRKEYVSPFYVAMVYAGLGDKENALAWLEKAYAVHDEWMVYLKIYPEFASLHGDPRFQDMERRVGLL